jgi:hypothetical protein
VYRRDTTALAYSSLESLIAAGFSRPCWPGMILSCRKERVKKAVVNHRVTLTLDSPGLIARLFGTRPEHVRVTRQTPGTDTSAYQSDSVPVRYVAPQLPMPDSATWAAAAKGRRKYEASITSITRDIKGVGWQNDLWLAVGDSTKLEIEETRCQYDSCFSMRGEVGDSGWSIGDTSMVQIRTSPGGGRFAYGRHTGKTIVRVRGLHGSSDTMPSRDAPARRIERKITVGRPIRRVSILPRPDTVLVGQPYTFRAQAFDSAGWVIPDVPIEIVVDIGKHLLGMVATQPTSAEFQVTGRRLVVATFRDWADTLVVTVVDKNQP